MKRLYWRIYILLLSLRWIKKFNLGDTVIYKGKEWMLMQGVCSPRWDLTDGQNKVSCLEKDMKKKDTFKNYWGSYRSGVRFYMTSWYSIWVNGGIKPWMRGCRIW